VCLCLCVCVSVSVSVSFCVLQSSPYVSGAEPQNTVELKCSVLHNAAVVALLKVRANLSLFSPLSLSLL
jgi:hypothetical protein